MSQSTYKVNSLNSSSCYLTDYLAESSLEKFLKGGFQTPVFRIARLTITNTFISVKKPLKVVKEKIQS